MKIRSRARVSLPTEVREALQVIEGDFLLFTKADDGAFVIRAEKKSGVLGLKFKTPTSKL